MMEQKVTFTEGKSADPDFCKVFQVFTVLGGRKQLMGTIESLVDGSDCHYYPAEEGIEHSKAFMKAVIAKIVEIEPVQ